MLCWQEICLGEGDSHLGTAGGQPGRLLHVNVSRLSPPQLQLCLHVVYGSEEHNWSVLLISSKLMRISSNHD